MYGLRMIWNNRYDKKTYKENLVTLDMMNLCNFCRKFKVGIWRPYKNKICHHLKESYAGIFYLKRSSNPNNDLYTKYCKYSLIKFKLWIGNKVKAYRGENNYKENVIKLWDNYVTAIRIMVEHHQIIYN